MHRKIKCALAGTGRIGSSLENDRKREKPASHAGAIFRNPDTCLVAGADTDEEKRNAFGTRWKISGDMLFSSVADMLDTVMPDILHIATGTESHIHILRTAIEHKTPVVVLEKPVAETVELARKMLPLIEKCPTRIVVNHERRFSADYIYAKSLIRKKIYGDLLSVNARLFLGRTRKVRDVLWHDGTHMIDIIRYLVSQDILPLAVHGNPQSYEGNVFLAGRAGDCDMMIECSPGRDYLCFEIDLSFERGRIRIGNGIFDEQESRPSPYYENFRSLVSLKRRFPRTGYFSGMMRHAVELFRNPEAENLSSFSDGLAAIETIQAFLDMAQT